MGVFESRGSLRNKSSATGRVLSSSVQVAPVHSRTRIPRILRTQTLMHVWKFAAAGALALTAAGVSGAQQSVSRGAAIASAIERGPRVAIARADSASARAQLSLARQYENPVFGLSYTKDSPQHHLGLDIPLDLPWFRNPRISFARSALDAASLRFLFERETVAYDADTTYTQAVAAEARARLSRANARDADSLLAIARVRRDAGDASELDVQQASLSAGQLANAAASDSVEAIDALLAVQAAMGLSANAPTIALADTLAAPAPLARADNGTPLQISLAEQNVRAADLGVAFERRMRFGIPALSLGFDTHDPGGQGNTILPAIGIAVPLPLFNQNSAAVQAAEAQRDRLKAELDLARIEVNAALAQAQRAFAAAVQRAARAGQLTAGANRVSALALLAYREGAATLASVLEAQRTSREALTQYVDDVAAARNAESLVHLLERTASGATNANRTNQ